MSKKESFILKIYNYISGELHMVVKQFDRIEDAVEDGWAAAAHSFKVYDMHGECHHHHQCHLNHDHGPYG